MNPDSSSYHTSDKPDTDQSSAVIDPTSSHPKSDEKLNVIDSVMPEKKRFTFPNTLIAALVVFGTAGSIIAFLLPRLVSNNSQSPPFLLILFMGLIMIVLMGIPLSIIPSTGLNIKRRALVLAFAVNSVIVIVKFVLVPLGLYSSNRQSPFTVGNPLTSSSLRSPITVALGAFILYAFFLWLIKNHYVSRFYRDGNKDSKSLIRKILHSIGAIVVIFLAVVAVDIIAGGFLGIGAYLGEVGNIAVISTLLLLAFVLTIYLFRTSYFQAKESRDVLAISGIFWIMLSIILLYHVMWVIFSGALITIWPFKTVLPTPTK